MQITKEEILSWGWKDFEPYYASLENQPLSAANVEGWLKDWSTISSIADELYNRLYVAVSTNTADEKAAQQLEDYMHQTYPHLKSAEQKMKQKLLASGLKVEGMEVPLRNMRAEVDFFREENLELEARQEKLNTEHDKVMGAQNVEYRGEQKTVRQMEALLWETDRHVRREGWEKLAFRQLEDREIINQQWMDYMELRRQMARNADKENFRAYRWQQLRRFDYTPEDCVAFQDAIEEAVVPAVSHLMERRKKALGIAQLRYYDLFVDLSGKPPLAPFKDISELTKKANAVFYQVHPDFGKYFTSMDKEGLLDLANRQNKAAGAYCTQFSYTKRPFIFANAVGIHDDVQSILHESGHAFHAFETFSLPYFQQYAEYALPMEFAEVASMGMEFLALPYLEQKYGGFYEPADSARARVDHIEASLLFWPYMAMVDAFQHWAYENFEEGCNPQKCDEKWGELEARFRPHIDWSGYEEVMKTGWQRKDHIHQAPFYYVEYGLAQLGAVQIWAGAIQDQSRAVSQYRRALALGGTAPLPKLFETAGAEFAFNAQTLKKAVELMTEAINELEKSYRNE